MYFNYSLKNHTRARTYVPHLFLQCRKITKIIFVILLMCIIFLRIISVPVIKRIISVIIVKIFSFRFNNASSNLLIIQFVSAQYKQIPRSDRWLLFGVYKEQSKSVRRDQYVNSTHTDARSV